MQQSPTSRPQDEVQQSSRQGDARVDHARLVEQLHQARAAEQAARRSETELRHLLEILPAAAYTCDADGMITYYNPRAAEVWGREPKLNDSVERFCGSFKLYTSNGALVPHSECWMALALRDGKSYEGYEIIVERPDGGRTVGLAHARPLFDDAGRVRGAVNVVVDVTERKRAEEALRKTLDELEQRVAERTAELEQQASRLRDLAGQLASAEHRERKRLAAVLHDELQQYLVAAKMRLARADRSSATSPSAIGAAQELLDQAIALSRDLTRQLRPPVLYEDGLVPALHWLASDLSQRHDLTVELEVEEEEALPLDDDVRALLFESIRELLFNVAKHAGVDRASIRVARDDDQALIDVTDCGVGFDHRLLMQHPVHMGQGLFSVRERLLAMGGDLLIESAPNAGTRVRLTVPIVRAPAEGADPRTTRSVGAPASPGAVEEGSSGERPRVLVVDDHAIVRQGIANMLRDDPRVVVVAEARDGEAAIEAVERYGPDVVLMDVNMPGMNGIEATRAICRRWPRVAVLGLSVQDDETTAHTMRRAGAAAFISKSDDADRMISVILSTQQEARQPI